MNNYTYILRCNDNTLYTGWTNNLKKRIETHNAGKGGKYTSSRLPVNFVFITKSNTKSLAMSLEKTIKTLTKKEKEWLINSKYNIIESMEI